ncbi:MAG: hypothetical protein ABI832_15790 [bacterium]
MPDGGLAVVSNLFGRLHAAQLRYCHWKSNEHVGAAVQGQTDLDVLVEPGRSDELQGILAASGFRRFQPTAITAYPAVEDYLACDETTARIVHLHLHYRLTLGQKHLKGYRLPWEEAVLASRRLDSQHGVYVSAPEMELLLLVVRDALKRRLRSHVAVWLGRNTAKGDFAREYAWLAERTTDDAVVALATRLIGVEVEAPLRRILENGARPRDLISFAAVIRPALSHHRTYGRLSAALLMPVREVFWSLGGLSRKHFHWTLPFRRISPRGGVVVVFLGSDGAGKSTQCAGTVTWLSQKLDVVPVYFGSGDGPSSLLRMPLQFARRLVDRRAPSSSASQRRAGWRGRLRSVALIFWALSLSLEKRGKLRQMIRARNRGLTVICDRFAQSQIEGFNDGRLLGKLSQSNWRFLRALAAWEARPYHDALLDPPDLVIKLVASPDVALSRRPEMTADEIERRIAAVRSLRFPDQTRVLEIDADQSLEAVNLAVRRQIWELL